MCTKRSATTTIIRQANKQCDTRGNKPLLRLAVMGARWRHLVVGTFDLTKAMSSTARWGRPFETVDKWWRNYENFRRANLLVRSWVQDWRCKPATHLSVSLSVFVAREMSLFETECCEQTKETTFWHDKTEFVCEANIWLRSSDVANVAIVANSFRRISPKTDLAHHFPKLHYQWPDNGVDCIYFICDLAARERESGEKQRKKKALCLSKEMIIVWSLGGHTERTEIEWSAQCNDNNILFCCCSNDCIYCAHY